MGSFCGENTDQSQNNQKDESDDGQVSLFALESNDQ